MDLHLYTVMLRSHVCFSPYPSTNPSPLPSPLRSLLPSTMPLRLHAPSGPSPFPPPVVTSPFSFFSPLPPQRFPSPSPTTASNTYSSSPQHSPTSAATRAHSSTPQHPITTVPRRPGSCLFAPLTAATGRFLPLNPSLKMKPNESFALNAATQQLTRLLIETFSRNKKIFLRELLSHASDMLDRLRYEAITVPDKLQTKQALYARLLAAQTCNPLPTADSGIAVTQAELVTQALMEPLHAGGHIPMTGHLGGGSYSAYLVAHRVTVVSKRNGGEPHDGESPAGGSFTLQTEDTYAPFAVPGRGGQEGC